MHYKKLGKSDLELSVIGLGTWAMGNDYWGQCDDDDSISAIQAGIDNGINLIDTAPAYGSGHAEMLVGKAIKGRRDSVIVATKVGSYRVGESYVRDLKPERIMRSVEDSLRLLDIDCIDLYQIHWPDVNTPIGESMAALEKLHRQGKFRWLGVSNFSAAQIDEACAYMDIVSLQPRYSLLDRGIEQELLPYCIDKGIGVLTYGSLGAGILSGKYDRTSAQALTDRRVGFYPYFKGEMLEKTMMLLDTLKEVAARHEKPVSQVAVNWVWAQEGVTCALVGAKNAAQARENALAGHWALDEADLAQIGAAWNDIFGGAPKK